VVVLEDVRRLNVASILRTCDALGVGEVFWVHSPRSDGNGFGRNEWGQEGMPEDVLTKNFARDPDLVGSQIDRSIIQVFPFKFQLESMTFCSCR